MILITFCFAFPRISPRFAVTFRPGAKSLILLRLDFTNICKIAFSMVAMEKSNKLSPLMSIYLADGYADLRREPQGGGLTIQSWDGLQP